MKFMYNCKLHVKINIKMFVKSFVYMYIYYLNNKIFLNWIELKCLKESIEIRTWKP